MQVPLWPSRVWCTVRICKSRCRWIQYFNVSYQQEVSTQKILPQTPRISECLSCEQGKLLTIQEEKQHWSYRHSGCLVLVLLQRQSSFSKIILAITALDSNFSKPTTNQRAANWTRPAFKVSLLKLRQTCYATASSNLPDAAPAAVGRGWEGRISFKAESHSLIFQNQTLLYT